MAEDYRLSGQQEHAVARAHRGGHVMIAGGPGGGKTVISRKIYRQLSDDVRFQTERLSFNKHTKDAEVSALGDSKNFVTFSGLDWRIFSRHFGLSYKTWKPAYGRRHRAFYQLAAAEFWEQANGIYEPEQLQAMDDLKRVHSMVLATLFDPAKWGNPDEIDALVSRWSVELTIPSFIYQSLAKVMRWTVCGLDTPVDGNYWSVRESYEFEDLTYMIATTPSIRVETKKIIMPDEIQDMTTANWMVMRRRLGGPAYQPGERRVEVPGQIIASGDQNQSIYRFRNVYPDMWGRIANATGAAVCPLTESFRLGHALLPRPKVIVPSLTCHVSNPVGAEVEIDIADVLTLVQPGHVFLFLTNAQSIRMAYWGIRHNRPFVVRGTEIGLDMKGFADQIGKTRGFRFEELMKSLEEYETSQTAFCHARYKPDVATQKIASLQERCSCLAYLYEGAWSEGIRTLPAFRERIGELFADEKDAHGNAAICMTYHKSKGLEFPVVYQAEEDLKSVRLGIHPEDAREHQRVLYVGLTRVQTLRYILRDSKVVRNTARMV